MMQDRAQKAFTVGKDHTWDTPGTEGSGKQEPIGSQREGTFQDRRDTEEGGGGHGPRSTHEVQRLTWQEGCWGKCGTNQTCG